MVFRDGFLNLVAAAFTGVVGAIFLPTSSAFFRIRAFNWLISVVAASALVKLAIRSFGSPYIVRASFFAARTAGDVYLRLLQ